MCQLLSNPGGMLSQYQDFPKSDLVTFTKRDSCEHQETLTQGSRTSNEIQIRKFLFRTFGRRFFLSINVPMRTCEHKCMKTRTNIVQKLNRSERNRTMKHITSCKDSDVKYMQGFVYVSFLLRLTNESHVQTFLVFFFSLS